jgi:hypothetical protein
MFMAYAKPCGHLELFPRPTSFPGFWPWLSTLMLAPGRLKPMLLVLSAILFSEHRVTQRCRIEQSIVLCEEPVWTLALDLCTLHAHVNI